VLRATIALRGAYRCVPSAAGPPSGVSLWSDRRLQGSEIETADVGSGSAPTGQLGQQAAVDQSVLAMAAAAALQRHETAVATAHLRRLLPLLEPGSEDAAWVQARLADVAATTRGTAPVRP